MHIRENWSISSPHMNESGLGNSIYVHFFLSMKHREVDFIESM